MNRIEIAAQSTQLKPLQVNRATLPTLACPAFAWAFIQGVTLGYALADMAFGSAEMGALGAFHPTEVEDGMSIGELIELRDFGRIAA